MYITSLDVAVGSRVREEPFLGTLGPKTSIYVAPSQEWGPALVHIYLGEGGAPPGGHGYQVRAEVDVAALGAGLDRFLANEQALADWVATQPDFRLPLAPTEAGHEFEVYVVANRVSVSARLLDASSSVFAVDGRPVVNDGGWDAVHQDDPLLALFAARAAEMEKAGGDFHAFLRSMHAFVLQLGASTQETRQYGVRIWSEPRQGATWILDFVKQDSNGLDGAPPAEAQHPAPGFSFWNPLGDVSSASPALDGWQGPGVLGEPLGPFSGGGQLYAPWTTAGHTHPFLSGIVGPGAHPNQNAPEPVPIPSAWPPFDGGGGHAYYGLSQEVFLASVQEDWSTATFASGTPSREMFRDGKQVQEAPGNLLDFLQSGRGGFQLLYRRGMDDESYRAGKGIYTVRVPPGAIDLNRMFEALGWPIPDSLQDGVVLPGTLSGAYITHVMSLDETYAKNRLEVDFDSDKLPFKPFDVPTASAHAPSEEALARRFAALPGVPAPLAETAQPMNLNAALSMAPSLVVASEPRGPLGPDGVFKTGFQVPSSGRWSPYVTTRVAPMFSRKGSLSTGGIPLRADKLWFYYLVQEDGLLVHHKDAYVPLVLVPGPVGTKRIVGAQEVTWDDRDQTWVPGPFVPNPESGVARPTMRRYWHGEPAHFVNERHTPIVDPQQGKPIAVNTDIYDEAIYSSVVETVAAARGEVKVQHDGEKIARTLEGKWVKKAPLYPPGVVEFPVADIYRYQRLTATDFFDFSALIVKTVFRGIELSHPIRLYKNEDGRAFVHPEDHVPLARMTLAGETFVPVKFVEPPAFAVGVPLSSGNLKDAEAFVLSMVPLIVPGTPQEIFKTGIQARGDNPSLRALVDEPHQSSWVYGFRQIDTMYYTLQESGSAHWGDQKKPEASLPRIFLARPKGFVDVKTALGAGTKRHAAGNMNAVMDRMDPNSDSKLAIPGQVLPENIVGSFEFHAPQRGWFEPNPSAADPLPRVYEWATVFVPALMMQWEPQADKAAAEKRAQELMTTNAHANPLLTLSFEDDRPKQVLEGAVDFEALRALGEDYALEFGLEWEALSVEQQAELQKRYKIPQDPNRRLVRRMFEGRVVNVKDQYPAGVEEMSVDNIVVASEDTPTPADQSLVDPMARQFVERGIDLKEPIRVYWLFTGMVVWKSDVLRFLALKRMNEETIPIRQVPHPSYWPKGTAEDYPQTREPAFEATMGVEPEQWVRMKSEVRTVTIHMPTPKPEQPFKKGFAAKGTHQDLLDYYWYGLDDGFIKTFDNVSSADKSIQALTKIGYLVRPRGGLAPQGALQMSHHEVLVPSAILPEYVLGSAPLKARSHHRLWVNPDAKDPLLPEYGFANAIVDVPVTTFLDAGIRSERTVGELTRKLRHGEYYAKPILIAVMPDRSMILLHGHDTLAALYRARVTDILAAAIDWSGLSERERQTLKTRFREAFDEKKLALEKKKAAEERPTRIPEVFVPKTPRILDTYHVDNKVELEMDERLRPENYESKYQEIYVLSTHRPELLQTLSPPGEVPTIEDVKALVKRYPEWVSLQIAFDERADLSMTFDANQLEQHSPVHKVPEWAKNVPLVRPIPGLGRQVSVLVKLTKQKAAYSRLSNAVSFDPKHSAIGLAEPKLVPPSAASLEGGLEVTLHHEESGFKARTVRWVFTKTTYDDDGHLQVKDYIAFDRALEPSEPAHSDFVAFGGPSKSAEGVSLWDFLKSRKQSETVHLSAQVVGEQPGDPVWPYEHKIAARESPLVALPPSFWTAFDQFGHPPQASSASPGSEGVLEPFELTARKLKEFQGLFGTPDYPELMRAYPAVRELLSGLPVADGAEMEDEDLDVIVDRMTRLVERKDVSTHGEWDPKWDRTNFPQFRSSLYTQLFGPLITTGLADEGGGASGLGSVWIRKVPGSRTKLMFQLSSSASQPGVTVETLVRQHQDYPGYSVHTLSAETLLKTFRRLDTQSPVFEAWSVSKLGPAWMVSLVPIAASAGSSFHIGLMPKHDVRWNKEIVRAEDVVDEASSTAVHADGTIDLVYLTAPGEERLSKIAASVVNKRGEGRVSFELVTLGRHHESGVAPWTGTVRIVHYRAR